MSIGPEPKDPEVQLVGWRGFHDHVMVMEFYVAQNQLHG